MHLRTGGHTKTQEKIPFSAVENAPFAGLETTNASVLGQAAIIWTT